MSNWIKVVGVIVLSATLTIIALSVLFGQSNDKIIIRWKPPSQDVVEMPIVEDSRPLKHYKTGIQENRGTDVREFLSASVKIQVAGGSGSGTIIYYDQEKGIAYVISCGHLWKGNSNNSGGSAKITTWYHNQEKLQQPKTYNAKPVFWSNDRGYDCSLLTFAPDWQPDYFPIASIDYPIIQGMQLHSCGCDGAKEVAHYIVKFLEYRGADLVTVENSPRPGRSGGGLLSSDGLFVGICWGTSDTTSGGGVGYFTPLKSIHTVYERNGYGWLLNVGSVAQMIPILDKKYPNTKWDKKFIPIPIRPQPIPTNLGKTSW